MGTSFVLRRLASKTSNCVVLKLIFFNFVTSRVYPLIGLNEGKIDTVTTAVHIL